MSSTSASETAPNPADFLALTLDSAAILQKFKQAKDWQTRYREIMLLGKSLPSLDEQFRVEQAQVRGCESQAWLYHHCIDNKHYFLADSDARVVKGLIALLLAATHGQNSQTILELDIEQYFDELGLTGQLSPSRTNGLFALAAAIKAAANV